jgi:hypothetical protein
MHNIISKWSGYELTTYVHTLFSYKLEKPFYLVLSLDYPSTIIYMYILSND